MAVVVAVAVHSPALEAGLLAPAATAARSAPVLEPGRCEECLHCPWVTAHPRCLRVSARACSPPLCVMCGCAVVSPAVFARARAAPGASFYDGEDEEEPAAGSLTAKMAKGLVTGGDHDREVQWGYLSAHHSQNKVLEEAFARHQQAQLEQAETKARESQEVGARCRSSGVPYYHPSPTTHPTRPDIMLAGVRVLPWQTEEAMWQQELENRRRRRIAQQEKRELQEYIKKQMAEQKERQRLERESWKSLAPAPRALTPQHDCGLAPLCRPSPCLVCVRGTARSVYGTQEQLDRTRDFNSHLDTNLVPQQSAYQTADDVCATAGTSG